MTIDPDTLNDEQLEIYEAGYAAGQQAVAERLHQLAREYETENHT